MDIKKSYLLFLIVLLWVSCAEDDRVDVGGELLAGEHIFAAGHYFIDKTLRLAPGAVLRADGIVIFDWYGETGNILIGASNTLVEGITFIGGHADGTWPTYNGGAVCVFNADGMIIKDCNFIDNYTRKRGGGVYCFKSSVRILNCHFEDNAAGTKGGGIHGSQSVLNIFGCDFMSNQVTGPLPANPDVDAGHGGAIHISNYSRVIVQDCAFQNNYAILGYNDVYVSATSSIEWQ